MSLWTTTMSSATYFHDSNRTCTNLVRTFPLAQHDSNNAEDMDTHGDDHALDSCRYLLAVRPISAQHRAERRPTTLDERFAAKLRKLDRRRR